MSLAIAFARMRAHHQTQLALAHRTSGMRPSRWSAHACIPLANAGVRYGNGN